MNPNFPGHEPDDGDMSFDMMTDPTSPHPKPSNPGLIEEDEATKLGDFASW